MKKPLLAVLVAALTLGAMAAGAAADLREYVQRSDESFAYELVNTSRVGAATVYMAQLTSQTWQGRPWQHWLVVLVPDQPVVRDRAVLVIGGGRNTDREPNLASGSMAAGLRLLAGQGFVMAYVGQVPNQPLYDGRVEDDLIAFTFDKYLSGDPGDDWPLLLPMTRSATAAMDAVQDILREKAKMDIESFVVTGASKRGWTTWLTAAVDARVIGIAPMVIDMLNLAPQMNHQKRTWGQFSASIADYVNHNVLQRMGTERGRQLVALVDPFSYRERLTMPKLVVLGTNDAYWPVDAARFYFDALAGPKALYYAPNAGHGLGMSALPATFAFIRATLQDRPLAKLQWTRQPDGALHVSWDDEQATATLWRADSADRDFQEVRWTSEPIDAERKAIIKRDAPAQGWAAWFVEVTFPNEDGSTYTLSTEMTVLPESMPFE